MRNQEVEKVVENLQKNKFVYKGKIKAPAGENDDNWVEREQLLFKSTDFGDDKDRALQKSDGAWTILLVMLLTTKINWTESLTT